MLVLVVWLSLSAWLSAWAFKNAEGWWRVPSCLGAVVSVIGVAVLLVLAFMWLISEYPDILTDDSKRERKGSRNRRQRTGSSRGLPNARGTLAVAGLGLLATASVVVLMSGWTAGLSAWAGEVLGDLVVGWLEQRSQ